MADLTQYAPLPTVQSIYRHFEEKRGHPHRPHLGASQIGHACDRYLWYQFRWCGHEEPEGRVLRLFDHGDVEETRLVRDLRAIGVTVYDLDPDTGRQFTFTAFGGHFGCSLDGVGQGFSESGKWHLLEFKTSNAKKFASLQKDGLEKWNPQYWAQILVAMELSGLPRTMHMTTCKDNDHIYAERVKEQPTKAARYLDRAERVIFSEEPLERVSERPDWYECKWCCMHGICHGDQVAEVNCRTCVHSTPERDGTWTCAKHNATLSTKEQRQGCESHLMRPNLVPYADAMDSTPGSVEYKSRKGLTFWNHVSGSSAGERCYTSHEMHAAKTPLPMADDAENVRQQFGGAVTSYREDT